MSHGADKEISFTLNGQAVVAQPGETVLSVAQREGITIPTLCHHESVTPYGACRLCVVEVSWGKRSKMVTSCIYIPYEGDNIATDNEAVRRLRAMIIEMLWSRHPKVEVLGKLAREYGVEEPRFPTGDVEKTEKCIHCGLCVRVCAEVVGANAIGYASRGIERHVTTPFDDQTDECIGCGACVYICPADALHYEDIDGVRRMTELHTDVPLVACVECEKPFATEQQIARIREKLSLTEAMAQTCPNCRGVHHRGIMEKVLTLGKTKN